MNSGFTFELAATRTWAGTDRSPGLTTGKDTIISWPASTVRRTCKTRVLPVHGRSRLHVLDVSVHCCHAPKPAAELDPMLNICGSPKFGCPALVKGDRSMTLAMSFVITTVGSGRAETRLEIVMKTPAFARKSTLLESVTVSMLYAPGNGVS
eukprot:3358584-Rhodomonas_salina.2